MDSFRDNLIKRGYDVEIVLYENLISKGYTQTIIKKYQLSEIHIANVVDYTLEKRIKVAAQELDVRIYWYDSPGFLLNQDEVENDNACSLKTS